MQNPTVSLLWIDGKHQPPPQHDSFVATDLNLTRLIWSLSLSPQYENHVRGVLLSLTTDMETIRYRQAVLADLLRNPELVQRLYVVLEEIIALEGYLSAPQWKENVLRQVAWRLSELERYMATVLSLDETLTQAGGKLQSQALQQLRTTIRAEVESEMFQHLLEELPDLLPRIRAIRSITVTINLDTEMRPLSAALLEARTDSYVSETMMSRLFGFLRQDDDKEEASGKLHNARHIKGVPEAHIELRDRNSPFMPQLFKDLSELLDETSRPIVQMLRKYTQITSQFLVALKMDLAFYLGAVKLIERLRDAGLPMCEPEPLPIEKRESQFECLYNINLALQHLNKSQAAGEIVGNDVHFGEAGRIFILTGPNQGGKTTYTQAIGLAQLLFQAGLHVPAQVARMSPVDGIFTHFSAEERPNLEAGRLGEEARRLNDIFQHATRYSLVLLNESLASTAASESLYLAQDVVKAFRVLGVRAVFATHLHELAANADIMNRETAGDSHVISLVSQVQLEPENNGQQVKRTYRIVPGPPMSKSYAIELAARYGISFEQLTETLKKRDAI
jgi:DNA mismatch repair protein MutS